MTDRTVTAAHHLLTLCIDRAEAQGWKGKRADDYALEFLLGAACGAQAAGDDALYNHLSMIAALVVTVRGMFGVREARAKLAERIAAPATGAN